MTVRSTRRGPRVPTRTAAGDPSEEVPDRRRMRARAIRQAMEDLGPLYIKVGQMLFVRQDRCPVRTVTLPTRSRR
jgi:ubiquinone biosynthesis protein